MSTPEPPPGHETEERTTAASRSPQSPQEATTAAAPATGEGTDVSYRTGSGPEEELAVGEDVNPSSPSEGAVEPPD